MASRGGGGVGGNLSYLSQQEAIRVDEELMGPRLGFSVDQLMELAGLSCACALAEVYDKATHPAVLVFCGPGNNGGDGLVAARHLTHFGRDVRVCYPKRTDRELYKGLVKQLESLGVPFVEVDEAIASLPACSVVLDAMFGFSFKGEPRPPFKAVIEELSGCGKPIVSVDIPSGWHVDQEDGGAEDLLRPEMLISLTAPKECARRFKGKHHFLGGRFVPPEIRERFGLSLPEFPGTSQCVRIS
ncbi:pyridoxamine 5'-phosphate oxidase [Chloropicon primus]|uniref:NAD(P)H-hydrate epimerase n=1 Tax=Chloropicon primus TaxID=1764295 RepID=A0A5B8MGZ5_9CHLO|nr:pyridoxamine 5'-phosphate oxidase [Chloropicon primus]UPQ99179.1 pyridoxamine 5'-phosphate oxidase [Chloropicon primus]|eukprot:QDZ19968.1 pyridoxamine 5'-phosphate oxidase [Chloropicon primus]